MRDGDLEAIATEVGIDTLVREPLDPEHPLRTTKHVREYRQVGGPDEQLADFEAVDVQRRHHGLTGESGNEGGRHRRTAETLGRARGDRRAVGARVEHQPVRSLTVYQHGRPDAPDPVAPCW